MTDPERLDFLGIVLKSVSAISYGTENVKYELIAAINRKTCLAN